jgi:regulator of protease activity HflC (stomatin/prohibitin superfamily)
MHAEETIMTTEQEKHVPNGWLMLPIALVLLLGGVALTILGALGFQTPRHSVAALVIVGILVIVAGVLLMPGFFTLQPNEARVLILFGAYKGTARSPGFHWANPFFSNGPAQSGQAARTSRKQAAQDGGQKSTRGEHRYKVSLRARTLNMEKLKVNGKRGNPIEIAAVVVWNVNDTAQAIFDVDDYSTYVATQSETALRHLASAYAYDHGETSDEEGDDQVTLRSNVEQVSDALRAELEERLVQAGVTVQQARLTHLAYSPEIAQAMLRRQQAEAVIAARRKIVTGAVSMVEMALNDLSEKHVVDLDEERKAAMVSNLMVVLCGEAEVHPVVNTGTLYT